MSGIYDNWEKLVGAVLRREKDRQLAYCESLSSGCSSDFSSRFSLDLHLQASIQDFNYSINSCISAALSDDACLAGDILPLPNLKVYSFADLKIATRSFKNNMVLGVRGFGTVYKGWVDERSLVPTKLGTGMMVAIKKLNTESMHGFEELQSEVNFVGMLSHPNCVKLLGYCWEDKELLLVSEFMCKGSLENHLFRRYGSMDSLSWDRRLKIAIGAARGLAFLHNFGKIYGEVKTSNILLDRSYNAKICDSGLMKLEVPLHGTTQIMETYGYFAPEQIATGHLYVKSNVYGFGVVLLELLTGLRAIDRRQAREQQNLVNWVKPLLSHKQKLKSIMDARIEGQYSFEATSQTADLALRCLDLDPRLRPPMQEVAEVLEQIAALEETKRVEE